MVFLLTDSEEYRVLKCPAVVSIGRGNTNDFRPESQSVSKQHATITITAIGFNEKVDAWLEDLDSRNGTYAGNSPLDLERVRTRRKLYDGDYIRFGHSQKYFRYLERIPVDAEATLPPELIVSPSRDLQKQLMLLPESHTNIRNQMNSFPNFPSVNPAPDFGKDGFNFQPTSDHNQLTSPQQQKRPEYSMNKQISAETMPLYLEPNYALSGPSNDLFAPGNQDNHYNPPDDRGQNLLAYHDHASSSQRVKSTNKQQQHRDEDSSDNMTISVNYPMGGSRRNYQHPVSITIDPSGSKQNKQGRRGVAAGRTERIEEDEDDDEEETYPDLRRSGGNKKSSSSTNRLITDGINSLLAAPTSPYRQSGLLPQLPQPWNAPFAEPPPFTAGYVSPVKHVPPTFGVPDFDEFRPGATADRFKAGVLDSEKEINSRMFRADATSKKSRLAPHNLHSRPAATTPETIRRVWPSALNGMPSSEVVGKFVDLITGEDIGTTYANHVANYVENNTEETSQGDKNKSSARRKKRSVGKAAELVLDLPSSIVAEVVAEGLSVDSHSDSTAGILNTVVGELNDLLQQCLQGSQIMPSGSHGASSDQDHSSSAEFDHVLKGVVAQAIQDTASTLGRLTNSSLLLALLDANSDGSCPNKITQYVQQSLDTLARANAFVLGSFLPDEARALRAETVYEILSVSLSSALDRLDACTVAIHTIVKRADGDAVQHENNHLPPGAHRAGASSLSVELEEMRRLKKDTELTPWLERIRQQEAGVLEKKMSRFYRVFDIALRHQQQAALYHWKLNVHALKRHELKIFDLTDRHVVRFKRSYFDLWSRLYKLRTYRRKALQRFGRVIGSRGKDQIRRLFHVWERATQQSRVAGRTSEEVATLKYEMCNLKATLHDVTGKNEVAANLAAERALNRELSAVNLELRVSLQQMEAKLLEVTGAQASKRKDLVFQHLIGKEEELAEARRESAFLLSELQTLSTINDKQQQRSPSKTPPGRDNVPVSAEVSNVEAFRRAQTAKQKMVGLPGGPSRPGVSSGESSIVMTKDIARQVVLNEVRRMQQALANNRQGNVQLTQKMQEEVNKNVQHALATQKLQSRLTAIERSTASLRELLRQRLGDVGVMELMESLERLGAGPAALMEVPANPSRDDLEYLGPEGDGQRLGLGVGKAFNGYNNSGGDGNSSYPRGSPNGADSRYYANQPVSRGTPPPMPSTSSADVRSNYSAAIDKHIYR